MMVTVFGYFTIWRLGCCQWHITPYMLKLHWWLVEAVQGCSCFGYSVEIWLLPVTYYTIYVEIALMISGNGPGLLMFWLQFWDLIADSDILTHICELLLMISVSFVDYDDYMLLYTVYSCTHIQRRLYDLS